LLLQGFQKISTTTTQDLFFMLMGEILNNYFKIEFYGLEKSIQITKFLYKFFNLANV